MEDVLTGKKHIHFIGIGRFCFGMYPLASDTANSQGYYLTGSDNNVNGRPWTRFRKIGVSR